MTAHPKPLSGRLLVGGCPEGFDARYLAGTVARSGGPVLHVARDDARLAAMRASLRFFAPDLPVLAFPAWDCLPYDRISPNPEIAAARVATLAALAAGFDRPAAVLTTVNAATQAVPSRAVLRDASFTAEVGQRVDVDALRRYLARAGFQQAPTVTEPGEFALRGGLIDLYPPGARGPVRLDLFGDLLKSARRFDPATQRTTDKVTRVELAPVSEVILDEASIGRFRTRYRAHFGAAGSDDPLYEAISAGRKLQGYEHWLPYFHDQLETILDYLPGAPVVLDDQTDAARAARWAALCEQYAARRDALAAKSKLGTSLQARAPGRALPRRRRLGRGPCRSPMPPARRPAATAWPGSDRCRRADRSRLRPRAPAGADQSLRRARRPHPRPPPNRRRGGRKLLRRCPRAPGRPPGRQRRDRRPRDPHLQRSRRRRRQRRRPLPRRLGPGARLRGTRPHGDLRAGCPRRAPDPRAAPPQARRKFPDRGGRPLARRSRGPRRPRNRPLSGARDGHRHGRAARMPAAGIRRRRQALPAGGEHRAAYPLWPRGGPARPPRRRGLAGEEGQAKGPHPRHGRAADPHCRRARPAQGTGADPARSPSLGRVLRPLPLCRDRGPAQRHLGRAGRYGIGPPHGPPRLRRRGLRQDRGGPARRLRCRHVRRAGGGDRPHHAARPPALQDFRRALPRHADAGTPALALRPRQGGRRHPRRPRRRHRRYRDRHPCAAGQGDPLQEPRPAGDRRGAALRRRPQGTPEGPARRMSTS